MGLEMTFSRLKTRTRIPGIRRYQTAAAAGAGGGRKVRAGCVPPPPPQLGPATATGAGAPRATPFPGVLLSCPGCRQRAAVPSRAGFCRAVPRALPAPRAVPPAEHRRGSTAAPRSGGEGEAAAAQQRPGPGTAPGAAGGRWEPRGGSFHARCVQGENSPRSSAFISRQRCTNPGPLQQGRRPRGPLPPARGCRPPAAFV